MSVMPEPLKAAEAAPDRAQSQMFAHFAAGIALLAIIIRLWMAWKTHSTAEDFLITLRYAENLAQGKGFVFNPGERVLGTTTPLYTLVLALCASLHLDAATCGKFINILADGITCWLLARLPARREIDLPIAGLFASLLYALSSTPFSISISGMETALVTCAGLAAIYATVANRSRSLLLLGSLLFLLRPDTLLLTSCLLVALVVRTRRFPWRDVGLAILILLPWLIFACLYFGSPIPMSLIAKVTAYSHGEMADRAAVYTPFRTQFLSGALQRVLTLLFALGALRVLRHREWNLTAPLIWLFLYYGIMLTSRVPAFPWYFLPPWPLFLLFAILGADGLLKGILRRSGRFVPSPALQVRTIVWQSGLMLVGLFGLAHLRSIRADIAEAQKLEDNVRRPVGLWLRANVKPQERVLLEPIGTIGYYSHCRLVDMIGLVSPEVLPSYRMPHPLADMIQRLRPEWLCLRPHEAGRLQQEDSSVLAASYRFVRDFRSEQDRPVLLLFHRKFRVVKTHG